MTWRKTNDTPRNEMLINEGQDQVTLRHLPACSSLIDCSSGDVYKTYHDGRRRRRPTKHRTIVRHSIEEMSIIGIGLA